MQEQNASRTRVMRWAVYTARRRETEKKEQNPSSKPRGTNNCKNIVKNEAEQ
jgi:hypothetical protein